MQQKINKPKAVLFDWDGTIVEARDPALSTALEATFAEMARRGYAKLDYQSWPLERIKAISNFLPRTLIRDTFLPHGQDVADQALAIYIESYVTAATENANNKALSGAMETFAMLRRQGIPFAIISSKLQQFLDAECDVILKTLYPDVICRGDNPPAPKKPDPAALRNVLQQLGVEPGKDVWMVGDTVESDLEAAVNAGCCPVFFRTPDASAPKSPIPEDTITVNGHKSLQQLIHTTQRNAAWEKKAG